MKLSLNPHLSMNSVYKENQKTVELEEDIKAIIKCIWCCYKANSYNCNLIHLLCKLSWTVYTALLLCFMTIELFKEILQVFLKVSAFESLERWRSAVGWNTIAGLSRITVNPESELEWDWRTVEAAAVLSLFQLPPGTFSSSREVRLE